MEIKYLKNREINRAQWDHCIETSFNGRVFAMSWYLDAVAENWDALIVGNHEAALPITYVKKFVFNILYQPYCTQQLGVFSKNPLPEETLVMLLKAIPSKFLFGKLHLNSENLFSEKQNFSVENRVNIELDIRSSYEILRKNYQRNITENLRKVRKNGIVIHESADYKQTIETYRANRGKERYYTGENYYDSIYKLLNVLEERQNLHILEARNTTGEFVAGLVSVPFQNRIMPLFLGCNAEGYKTGATSALFDRLIACFAEKKPIFDFEGSNTKSVADFYAGFGGKIIHYPVVTIKHIPNMALKIVEKAQKIHAGKN